MNKISIHGRLARDPELRSVNGKNGNVNVCNFTVACNRAFGDEADFFTCAIFGKRAEVINKFFSKGSEIIIYGEMQSRTYEKDNEKRWAWQVNVSDFEFCGSAKDSKKQATAEELDPIDDDDLPF